MVPSLKEIFNLRNDLLICSIYIPHSQVKVHWQRLTTDYFSELLNTPNSFLQQGNVIIDGDLDARVGRENNNESVDVPGL